MNLFLRYFYGFWVLVTSGGIATLAIIGIIYATGQFVYLFPREIRHASGRLGILLIATVAICLFALGAWILVFKVKS